MSLKITHPKGKLAEAIVLEELFLDQLTFKISAIMNLYTFKQESKREINSFIEQLNTITRENITLLQKLYDDRK